MLLLSTTSKVVLFAMADKLVSQKIKKIEIAGPESSGKTTLAMALSGALGIPCLPEYARLYLQSKGPEYDYKDYLKMVEGQLRWEQLLEERLPKGRAEHGKPALLIADTGALVLKVWGLVKFGKYPAVLDEVLPSYALFLLCKPDMPYEPDPLRENPHDRAALYAIYKELLQDNKLPFVELEGDEHRRLETALKSLCSL